MKQICVGRYSQLHRLVGYASKLHLRMIRGGQDLASEAALWLKVQCSCIHQCKSSYAPLARHFSDVFAILDGVIMMCGTQMADYL